MTKKTNRVYSRYTHQALALMAKLIRATRLDRGITTQELADRVGISRGCSVVVKFFWPRICIHSNKLVQRDLALPHHYADGALYGCNSE
jgi:hypothetical protein